MDREIQEQRKMIRDEVREELIQAKNERNEELKNKPLVDPSEWVGKRVSHKLHYYLSGRVETVWGWLGEAVVNWDQPIEAERTLGPIAEFVLIDDLEKEEDVE